MNATARLLVPVGAAAAGAGLALWLWPAQPAAAPAPAVPPVPAAAAPVPAAQHAEAHPTAPAQKPMRLRMPDGTEVEPLNGVKEPAPLVWGDRPYSPIVGKEHGNGIDWYVHADGTRSTTLDVMRSDLGRAEPLTLVARPHAAMPLDPADLAVPGGRKQ